MKEKINFKISHKDRNVPPIHLSIWKRAEFSIDFYVILSKTESFARCRSKYNSVQVTLSFEK